MRPDFLPEEPTEIGWLRLLIPRWRARSLFDVTAERLKMLGIEGVVFDMDNTLTEWRSEEIAPEVLEWVASILKAGLQTCVVSNTHREGRLKRLCETLGIDYVLGSKPRRKGFRTALIKMGTPPERSAIVGDQIFTDILGGNRLNLFTILVPPLSPKEFFGTRWISRVLERILDSYLQRMKPQGRINRMDAADSP